MKKLLLILLPIILFLVSCGGGGSDDLQPIDPPTLSLEETLVGKKWSGNIVDFGEIIFELKTSGELVIYNYSVCGYYISQNLGNWSINSDTISYTYIMNNLQIVENFGVVLEFNSSEILIYYNENTTSICTISNLPSITCTYIPDNNFEQELIDLGYDDVIDDYVKTANIETITQLELHSKNISDLTGIEDFSSLRILKCGNNQLTSLDVSNNTSLIELWCYGNQLTSLDVSNNTNLEVLECYGNQLSSLDVSNNTELIVLACGENQLSSLDVSNNIFIRVLTCSNQQLTNLNVSNNIALESLSVFNNQLTSLDVSNNISLTHLMVGYYFNTLGGGGNYLTHLDISNNTSLIRLSSIDNLNLSCIKVHNVSWANSIMQLEIEPWQFFSLSCP